MPLANTYSVGKITVTKNSVNFTGTDTLWKSAGLRDGDFMIINDAIGIIQGENTFGQPIASNTSGKFKRPWQGASGTYDYDAIFRSSDSRLTSNTQQVLQAIAGGLVEAFGSVNADKDMMPYFTGINSVGATALTPFARTLLDDADANATLTTLGFSEFIRGQANTSSFAGWGLTNANNNVPNDNLDTLRTNGVYRAVAGTIGNPTSSIAQVLHMGQAANYATQIAFPLNASVNVYSVQRFLINDVWTDWRPLVAQRGSNANGEFVRFADGTQICLSPDLTATLGTGITGTTWSFPVAFVSVPWSIAIANFTSADEGSSNARSRYLLSARSKSQSAAALNCQLIQGATAQTGNWIGNQIVSIGRWF